MANQRKPSPKLGANGPDLVDANQAVEALWRDYKLYFRTTVAFRDGRILFRGYAHDECSLSASTRSYQTYKQYDMSANPSIANVVYFLAFDLYWQAQAEPAPDKQNVVGELTLPG